MNSNFKDNEKKNSQQWLYLSFLVLIFLWCLLIVLAPVLARLNLSFASGLTYFFFSKICHQIPERSFFIFGKQLAVCSRCSGIYLGFLIGAVFYPLIKKIWKKWDPPRKYFFLALIPLFIDFSVNFLGIGENTFLTRSLTGFFLGLIAAFFIVPGVLLLKIGKYQHKDRKTNA